MLQIGSSWKTDLNCQLKQFTCYFYFFTCIKLWFSLGMAQHCSTVCMNALFKISQRINCNFFQTVKYITKIPTDFFPAAQFSNNFWELEKPENVKHSYLGFERNLRNSNGFELQIFSSYIYTDRSFAKIGELFGAGKDFVYLIMYFICVIMVII